MHCVVEADGSNSPLLAAEVGTGGSWKEFGAVVLLWLSMLNVVLQNWRAGGKK